MAERFLARQLPLVASPGQRPHSLIEALIRLLTRKGGCLLGDAFDPGMEDPAQIGRVKGSANLFVADLSASPLPRVSPQMTASLIGDPVAYQHSLARAIHTPGETSR